MLPPDEAGNPAKGPPALVALRLAERAGLLLLLGRLCEDVRGGGRGGSAPAACACAAEMELLLLPLRMLEEVEEKLFWRGPGRRGT